MITEIGKWSHRFLTTAVVRVFFLSSLIAREYLPRTLSSCFPFHFLYSCTAVRPPRVIEPHPPRARAGGGGEENKHPNSPSKISEARKDPRTDNGIYCAVARGAHVTVK